ncbi:BatD family protein [Sulfuriferula thiophila]|uniref:BatD family protein n=1 Tax=Sulfuriferula thiophila TaxID=1781211 RepID=UPI000F61323D|nr:BatD family protein [Sulfuriferula thiophila]
MRHAWIFVISMFMAVLSQPALAMINAWLNQNQVGSGESVQLTLQHEGETDKQPDLSPLKQNFDILGNSTGSSIQITNGKMSAKIQSSFMLMPKHSGKIIIPALQWDGQYSSPLTVTVADNNNAAQAGNTNPGKKTAHAFITTTVDQKQPFVQAAVTLIIRLYVDEPLYQASLAFEPNDDVLIQQTGKDQQTTETRSGQTYQVIERKYMLFPQRSGQIKLNGPVLNALTPDSRAPDPFGQDPFFSNVFGQNPLAGMMGAARPIRIQGDPFILNVRPRPTAATGHDWLPAQNVTLDQTWQPDSGSIRVGEPITRHLQLSALGVAENQLPDLSQHMSLPTGLRAYPDQPKLNTSVQGDSILSTRDQNIAIIASQAGHYVIPAMLLYWWDTTKNIQREISLPAHTLDVLPAVATTDAEGSPPSQINATTASQPATQLSPSPQNTASSMTGSSWIWISLGLGVLWLGTMFIWWRASLRKPKYPGSGDTQPAQPIITKTHVADARKAFQQACRDNNPHAARLHLIEWAGAIWSDEAPIGLKFIAERLDDKKLKSLLEQLDRACYTVTTWEGAALLEALKSLSDKTKPAARTSSELPDLYPGHIK